MSEFDDMTHQYEATGQLRIAVDETNPAGPERWQQLWRKPKIENGKHLGWHEDWRDVPRVDAAEKKTTAHIDYATQDPSIPTSGPDVCPTCGKELEAGYGMAGGGMGVYLYCPEHGITSKTQTD